MKIRKRLPFSLFTALLLLIYLVPVFFMIFSSVKPEKDIITLTWLPSEWRFDNYGTILEKAKISRWFINSVIVSVSSTLGILLVSILAGYVLGRMKFPGKKVLFYMTLAGFMIPMQAIMIPLFLNLSRMGMVNSYAGLILPGLASPVSVFILTQYFKGIDNEFEEAARLDGAGELTILFRIMMPMAIPAIATVALFNFSWSWNDFVWPLIIAQSEDFYTLPIGLVTLAGSSSNIRYGPIMAANVIATLPVMVMYFAFQKSFVRGVAMGELK